jgi:hypothetical protein
VNTGLFSSENLLLRNIFEGPRDLQGGDLKKG